MTGWYWLLNATGGRPEPYLIAYVPTVVVYVCVMAIFITFHYVHDLEQTRGEGKAVLSLNILVPIALVSLVSAFALVAVLYLARILFF